MNKRNLQRAVSRGAKLFDKYFDGDWAKRVNGATLDVKELGRCPLCQMFNDTGHYGAFNEGGRLLQINGDFARYGFESPKVQNSEENSNTPIAIAEYNYLTECWKEEIDSRVLQTA